MTRTELATVAIAVLGVSCGRIDFESRTLLETITVPSDGTVQQSATTLVDGESYELRASGTCEVGVTGPADAEYRAFSVGPPEDLASDGMTDLGLAIDDPQVSSHKSPSWGPYNSSHVYVVEVVGRGAPIQANLHDDVYANNSGSLTLEILGP